MIILYYNYVVIRGSSKITLSLRGGKGYLNDYDRVIFTLSITISCVKLITEEEGLEIGQKVIT